jgi:transcriptional regulator with XRE-family HTH domain
MKPTEFKTFGEWLRHRRLQLEVSPFRMAEELGYKRVSAIYNFEYGVAPVPMAKWPMLARVLEMTLDEFVAVMEQYAPEKAAEFHAIREAQSEPVGSEGKPSTPHRVIMPWPEEREPAGTGIREHGLEGARTVLVVMAPVEQSFLHQVERYPAGGGVGVIEIFSGQVFPGPEVVERLKQASTVGVMESDGAVSLSVLVKAAFLDGLTGVAGYPHIHRVPKIYTCVLEEDPPRLEPGDLHAFLGLLEKGSGGRLVRMTGRTPAAG